MREIYVHPGKAAKVSDHDFAWLSRHQWRLDRSGYAFRYEGNKRIRMHRAVCPGARRGMVVDHINGDRLDNRRENLRIITIQQNAWNRASSIGNTAYKGVCFHKRRGLWFSYLKLNGKQMSLGYHDTPEKAAEAYNRAAREHFGPFARLNEID